METSNFGPELHVAQQSRREKLRFSSHSDNPFSGHDPGNNLNPDLVQLRNLRYGNLSYEPVAFPPEVINFAATNSSQPLMFHQESANKVSGGDPQNCSTWKSIGSQETCDWIIDSNPNPVFVGSSSLKSNSNYNNYNFAPHEMAASWRNVGNELVLLPAFADQSPPLRCDNPCDGSNNNPQALSLSLSSIPLQNFGNLNPEMKAMKSEYLCSDVKTSSYNSKGVETDQHGMVSSNNRSLGPLGPFTGYATILKSSRFLRPAQQLLYEFCNMVGPNKYMKNLESHEKISSVIRAPCDDVNVSESIVGAVGGHSGGSSSTFYSCNNEKTPEVGGFSSSGESYRPEFLQKKAKLLYMLEEVCRRYKHYNQQMQMVVSAFETVAGLSAATPYICQALRSISKHFRCLRSAISDQLKNVRKALGEDLSSSPATGTSSSSKGGDTSMTSRLKLMDQTLQKQKAAGFFDSQPHVWRPQRGLPERAVAILRAWLFDHFLHPYPTDADKHMLATQTGLSRNQVSNWFINARVRLWKPMVEEIHMLETKGTPAETDARATNESVTLSNDHFQTPNRLSTVGFPEKQVECPEIGSGFIGGRMNLDDWNQKRSRVECQIPGTTTTMDGSLVGLVPYQQNGIDIGRSLGPVSLTLGLRRNADGLQQQQNESHHHQQQQFRRHFGDQILYDFVG